MDKTIKKIRNSVDAIIVIENHLLVCDVNDKSFTYLPGGGIEVGESIPAALHREMQEELKKDIIIGRYTGYVDQLFELAGKHIHEICHYFQVELIGVTSLGKLEAFAEVPSVRWVPIDSLADVNLKPDVLRSKIPCLSDSSAIWTISQNEIVSNKSV